MRVLPSGHGNPRFCVAAEPEFRYTKTLDDATAEEHLVNFMLAREPYASDWVLIDDGVVPPSRVDRLRLCGRAQQLTRIVTVQPDPRRVDEPTLQLLRLIADRGGAPEILAAEGLRTRAEELVTAGLVKLRYVDLGENAPALPRHPVYMLTTAGADAIGLNPWRVGLS